MNTYTVYFQFRDKKLAINLEARDKYDAQTQVEHMLEIHEVRLREGQEPVYDSKPDEAPDLQSLKDMFGFKD